MNLNTNLMSNKMTVKSARERAKKHLTIEHISVFGATSHMSPIGLHTYGVNFLNAARVAPEENPQFGPARRYLVCHAIELFLKAFLSIQKHPLAKLAGKYRHDLKKLLEEANAAGLQELVRLEKHQINEIERASEYYSEKVFEYPALDEAILAYPRTPKIDPLIEAANELALALENPCLAC